VFKNNLPRTVGRSTVRSLLRVVPVQKGSRLAAGGRTVEPVLSPRWAGLEGGRVGLGSQSVGYQLALDWL
jgi:hypothetical protein